jgi:hemoglobin
MSETAAEGAARRALLVADIVARTGIDEAMIDRVVRAFYARARQDELIGPIFEREVADWEAHFGRMNAFWSSVLLMSGRYHGSPMPMHARLPIGTAHFNRWLELFVQTAREVCPPAAAAVFADRANRIADSLEMGIAALRGESRARPVRPPSTRLPEGD